MKSTTRFLFLMAATAGIVVASVCLGPTSLLDWWSFRELLGQGASTPELERAALVLWELRLPRVLLAAAAGASLALGGLLLQAVFRNPLAEPYLLGLSSGGALGAVIALAAGASSVIWPALAGSLLIASVVLLLCRRRIASDLPSLLLAGVALGLALGLLARGWLGERVGDVSRALRGLDLRGALAHLLGATTRC